MRALVNTFPAAPLPPGLTIARLEILLRTAHHHGYSLRLSRVADADYRYFVFKEGAPDRHTVLMTNDIADVAGYLGVEGFLSDVHELGSAARQARYLQPDRDGEVAKFGPERTDSLPPLAVPFTARDLPRNQNGTLIPASDELKVRAQAMRVVTGYTMMDCRRALFHGDGNAEKALEVLIATNGFASSKI